MTALNAPEKLRLNLLTTPYNLRRNRLALSWHPGCDQAAYRVTVTEGRATPAYDSGWVTSKSCASVRPAGLSEALADGVLYYASVAVRDTAGLKTEGGAVIFSLPVDDLVGIGRFSGEITEE